MDRLHESPAACIALLVMSAVACGDGTGPADLAAPATLTLAMAPPASAPNRVLLDPQPVVQLRDEDGAAVAQAGTVVTAAVTTGGGTLGGTATATTTNTGAAAFTNLSIAGTVGEKILTFSASGLTSATATVTVTAGAATNIAVNAGNGQSAAPGAAVTEAPSVKVTDADANPVSGVAVTFAVTSGGGSIAGGSPSTDASGVATVGAWTLGPTAGTNTLTATVEGLTGSPITFTATGIAVDACRSTSSSAIALETNVTGALGALDCLLHGGQFHDFYHFTLASQQAVMISLRSQAFDPAVDLFTLMDQRDRGIRSDTVDSRREAKLKAILPPGAYETAASSVTVGGTGPYTLRVAPTSSDVESCERVFVVRGLTTAQAVTFADCLDGSGFYYADIYDLWLTVGERVTLTQSSTELVPQVLLYRETSELIAQATGFTTGTAAIEFEADATGHYYVAATSALILEVGAYTLSISDPSASAAGATPEPRSHGLAGEIFKFNRGMLERPLHWRR